MYEFVNEKYTEIFTPNWQIWIRAGIPPLANAQNENRNKEGTVGSKTIKIRNSAVLNRNQRVTKVSYSQF